MQYSHIIWDWNGTLLDDVNWCIAAMNQMLASRNMKTIQTLAEYHNVFCFPVIEYYRNVGFCFEKEPFETLAKEYIRIYHDAEHSNIQLHTDAGSILDYIKTKGITQILLSASAQDNLISQVTPFQINQYFKEVLGASNIYAKSKIETGQKYIAGTAIKKALLIGDTTHDYEVSKALKIECLLVAHGHHSKEKLCSCGVPVLEGLDEIVKYVK